MLEQLRQQSRSFIIWLMLGAIIVVFIISFGPQANGTLGCGVSNSVVAKINGSEVSPLTWAFVNQGTSDVQRAPLSMDLVVQRELLATAGDDMGAAFDTRYVENMLLDGTFFYFGIPANPPQPEFFRQDARLVFFGADDGKTPYFQDQLVRNYSFAVGLHNSSNFVLQQRREAIADLIRGIILSAPQVSEDEVWSQYAFENTNVNIEYVLYDAAKYKRQLTLSKAQIAEYLANNEEAVKAKYTAEEASYKERSAELRLHQIFVRKAPTPTPGPDVKDVPKSEDTAKTKAEALHAKIVAGASFADVARSDSEDPSKTRGGDRGWVNKSSLAPELSEAIKSLKSGELSSVIAAKNGYYILRQDGEREGDLTYEQVQHEIADELAKSEYAMAGAKADAEAALAVAQGGATLEQIFPGDLNTDPSQLVAIPRKAGDTVPRPVNLKRPLRKSQIRIQRSADRLGPIPSAEAVHIAFDVAEYAIDKKPTVFAKLFESGDRYYIVSLTGRQKPDVQAYKDEKAQLRNRVLNQKRINTLAYWIGQKCQQATIAYDRNRLTYLDDDGKPIEVPYTPCTNLLQQFNGVPIVGQPGWIGRYTLRF